VNLKSNRSKVWGMLRDPDYRNAFVSSTVAARIAVRIYNLRKKAGWTQPQVAEKAGMKQARVSVLEQGDYENFTFSTLKKLAAAFNVAVLVDFVSFPDFLKWSESINSESVAPESFAESDRALAAMIEATTRASAENRALADDPSNAAMMKLLAGATPPPGAGGLPKLTGQGQAPQVPPTFLVA
jgi:transcriptional regulator with XRE-family HTH domain